MRNKLTRLVVITCIALLGIIALQVSWLVGSYTTQKDQLAANVESALMEAYLLSGIHNTFRENIQQMVLQSLKAASRGGSSHYLTSDTMIVGTDTIISLINMDPSMITKSSTIDSQAIGIINFPSGDSPVAISDKQYTLKEYGQNIEKFLHAKHISAPFELALIDKSGGIIECSIDTMRYKKIKFKSNVVNSIPVQLNSLHLGRVQVAFPNIGWYLLKGMAAVMFVTLFLIVICGYSLSQMIAIFFRQKRISEIRNDFMNNMTHEFKTPISAVSVALELLQDQSVTMTKEEKAEYFHIADNELKRLTLLVNKVLKVAAFEKGQVKISKQKFAVRPWLQTIVSSFKPMLEPLQAKVTVTVYPMNMEIRADKTHLTNVIQNLLDNAIKYRDKAKEGFSIQLEAWEKENQYLIAVQDNGIGIHFRYLPRVFDKFFRAPTGDEHETKGYGLGLSYVKEIALLHGGDVVVESTYRMGTRFRINIPKT